MEGNEQGFHVKNKKCGLMQDRQQNIVIKKCAWNFLKIHLPTSTTSLHSPHPTQEEVTDLTKDVTTLLHAK